MRGEHFAVFIESPRCSAVLRLQQEQPRTLVPAHKVTKTKSKAKCAFKIQNNVRASAAQCPYFTRCAFNQRHMTHASVACRLSGSSSTVLMLFHHDASTSVMGEGKCKEESGAVGAGYWWIKKKLGRAAAAESCKSVGEGRAIMRRRQLCVPVCVCVCDM